MKAASDPPNNEIDQIIKNSATMVIAAVKKKFPVFVVIVLKISFLFKIKNGKRNIPPKI